MGEKGCHSSGDYNDSRDCRQSRASSLAPTQVAGNH